jgi:hypothetical protein
MSLPHKQGAAAVLALGVVVAVLIAYVLIAAVAVFYVAVKLPQALGVPVVASVGAYLAIGALLGNGVLKMRCNHRAVPANGALSPRSADLIGNGTAVATLLAKREASTPMRSRRRRHVVGPRTKLPTEAMSTGPQTLCR